MTLPEGFLVNPDPPRRSKPRFTARSITPIAADQLTFARAVPLRISVRGLESSMVGVVELQFDERSILGKRPKIDPLCNDARIS